MAARVTYLVLLLGFVGPGYAAPYRRIHITEILNPFKSCQFVITVESLAHQSPYLLPTILQELLKYQMEVWESPTFLLHDLTRYRRSMVFMRYSQTCIVHVTFPPKWRRNHYLNFPIFWNRKQQSVNVKKDVVMAFGNAGQRENYNFRFERCDYPVNSLILRYHGNTVDPTGVLRYTTNPGICGAQSYLCVQGTAPSEGLSLISKPYDQLLNDFKQEGKDFHQQRIFHILPPKLKSDCSSMSCMDHIPRATFIRDAAIAEFYQFYELAKRLNISGFVDVSHPMYKRLNCDVGTILIGTSVGTDPLYGTFPKVLKRYECYRLVYGDSRALPSPFKFKSLSEPFMPYVWFGLLISCLAASAYVLLTVRSMQLERTLGFVLSAWFGNEQRAWLPKPQQDSPGGGHSQFSLLVTSVASVGFFLICIYCAYVQTYIITPATYKSSKNVTELLAEGYGMFSHPVMCGIFHEFIKNAGADENTCPIADCKSPEYLHHAELGKVLQPVTERLRGDDNFWLLEKSAVLTGEHAISGMFGRLAKRFGRDYVSAKDEYLHTAHWHSFDLMPYSDVVVEVFQSIQRAGIPSWVRHWMYYWYHRKLEGTSAPQTNVPGFGITDTIIAESFLLFVFGMFVSLTGFLMVDAGVPTCRRIFGVVRSYWPIAAIKTRAKMMRLCRCFRCSERV